MTETTALRTLLTQRMMRKKSHRCLWMLSAVCVACRWGEDDLHHRIPLYGRSVIGARAAVLALFPGELGEMVEMVKMGHSGDMGTSPFYLASLGCWLLERHSRRLGDLFFFPVKLFFFPFSRLLLFWFF
jgi:hypothetical protein